MTDSQETDRFVERIRNVFPECSRVYIEIRPSREKEGARYAFLKAYKGTDREIWITSHHAKTVKGILNDRYYRRVCKELQKWLKDIRSSLMLK